MADEKDFYKELIDNLFDGVYFVDRERKITYWNKGAERITGYSAHHVVGHHCYDNLLNHVTANGTLLCLGNCPLVACMQDGKPREAEIFLHHNEGHRVPVRVRATPLCDTEGNIIGAVETFSNNSTVVNFRQQVRQLRRSTQIDVLTGVRNRPFLEGRLRALIAEFDHQTSTAGLLFLDIDHFKNINDTYGHEAGDKALQMVAATLHHNLRTTDVLGRWGGEEFIAILYDVPSLEALRTVAEKLRIMVENSHLTYDNHELSATLSIGATRLLPKDTPETIVRRADQLMYKSKQAGRNRVTVA
jgi:diguanylate cyclase (GGDEF)-like protein/PAS domain S-box-containing protein